MRRITSLAFTVLLVPFLALAQTDTQRIESEDKLSVPQDKAEEVWAYLIDRYITNTDFLKGIDPLLTAEQSDEAFSDVYYDTPDFTNLQKENGLRYRVRENLGNPEDAKSGRELIQIKINNVSDDPLARAEFKYDVKHPVDFSNIEDRHPLIGLVDPNQREDFKTRVVESLGIDPYQARPIIRVNQHRKRIYIKKNGVSAFTISFDEVTSQGAGKEITFTEIEPEINEIMYTGGDATTRAYLESVQAKLIADIQTAFPDIVSDLTPKYNKSFTKLEEGDPLFRQKILYGESNLMIWAVLAVLCPLFLIAFWIFTRRRNALSLA